VSRYRPKPTSTYRRRQGSYRLVSRHSQLGNRECPVSLQADAYFRSGPILQRTHCRKAPDKATNVGREEFGFFHCREMATTRHVGPLRDIEHSFQPYAWRVANLIRKVCKAHQRQYPLPRGETPGLQPVFPVHLNCCVDALGGPAEREVGTQLIFRKSTLDNTVAIVPCAKLLPDPRGQPGRRVVKRRLTSAASRRAYAHYFTSARTDVGSVPCCHDSD
jgi:hypothetical protein